jgi:hypothetical protein
VFGVRLNEIYAGTEDGRVLRVYNGTTDGMLIDGTGDYEVRARLTPAFSYLGSPEVRKRALMFRPQFLTGSSVGWSARMNVDFSVNPIGGTPVTTPPSGSLWDASFWDQALWSGGRAAAGEWRSVTGLGFSLAPSLFISSSSRTTLASLEYMVDAGGPL